MKYIDIAAVIFFLGGVVFAQENSFGETKNNIETCGNFKTPIIVPSKNIDSFSIVKPTEDVDFKLQIINPCSKDSSPPIFSQPSTIQPKTNDTLNLKPSIFDIKITNQKL